MKPLEQTGDKANSTEDPSRLIYDVINFSRSETLIFRDHDLERMAERRRAGASPLIPPEELMCPPLHMISIPDSWYRGKTRSGRQNPEVLHIFGEQRPLRQTTRFFRQKKVVTKVLPSNWVAVPLNDLARALIEQVRAAGGRKF